MKHVGKLFDCALGGIVDKSFLGDNVSLGSKTTCNKILTLPLITHFAATLIPSQPQPHWARLLFHPLLLIINLHNERFVISAKEAVILLICFVGLFHLFYNYKWRFRSGKMLQVDSIWGNDFLKVDIHSFDNFLRCVDHIRSALGITAKNEEGLANEATTRENSGRCKILGETAYGFIKQVQLIDIICLSLLLLPTYQNQLIWLNTLDHSSFNAISKLQIHNLP